MITTDNTATLVNALAEIELLKNEAVAADIRITNDAAVVDRLKSELETLSKIAGVASVERDAYKASADEQVALVLELAAERDALRAKLAALDPVENACKGKNCGSTNPKLHSAECFEEHAIASGSAKPVGYVRHYALHHLSKPGHTVINHDPQDVSQETPDVALYTYAAAGAAPVPDIDAIIDEMVGRFLFWNLPNDFCPDGFISFDRNKVTSPALWPTGTNLLNAPQAREMFRHVLAAAREPLSDAEIDGLIAEAAKSNPFGARQIARAIEAAVRAKP